MRARLSRNLSGAGIRRLRCLRKWSQEKLTSKLNDLGWNICRARLARIEGGEARVDEIECFLFAQALGVKMEDLFPKMDATQAIYLILQRLTGGQLNRRLMPPEEILAERSARLLNGYKILSRKLDNANPAKTRYSPRKTKRRMERQVSEYEI